MKKIAIFNQKGGVGKTTTSLNLAGALQHLGNEVLLMDLDPQAHLTSIFKHIEFDKDKTLFRFYQSEGPLYKLITPISERLSLIASNIELVKTDAVYGRDPNILKKLSQGLNNLQANYRDCMVVMDCSPYIGVVSLSAIFTCDLLVIPVASDYFSVNSAVKVDKTLVTIEQVLRRRIKRRYVLTRVDRRKKMTGEVEMELRRLFGKEVTETKISENIALAESPYAGKNIFEHQPYSVGAFDFQALIQELLGHINQAD